MDRKLNRWAWIKFRFRHYVLRQRIWVMTPVPDRGVHIVPVLDYFPHEAAERCLCHPVVELIQSEAGDEWYTTHRSFDDREQVES